MLQYTLVHIGIVRFYKMGTTIGFRTDFACTANVLIKIFWAIKNKTYSLPINLNYSQIVTFIENFDT